MRTPTPGPSRLLVRAAAVLTSGAATVGGIVALTYAQARKVAGLPGEGEMEFWIDGEFGPLLPTKRRVVWIGDSLAAGIGATDADTTLPRLVSLGRQETTRLSSFATPGATSADVVEFQLPALEQLLHGLSQVGQRIDVIAATVGANDIAAFTTRRRLRQNLATIVAAAEGVPVVLVSIPQLADAIRLPHPLRLFASWRAAWLDVAVRETARRHAQVHYASVRRRPEWIRRRDRLHFLAPDRFHPSGAGYAVWAERVAEAFEAALAPAVPATT